VSQPREVVGAIVHPVAVLVFVHDDVQTPVVAIMPNLTIREYQRKIL
jgi:hypothetical protein